MWTRAATSTRLASYCYELLTGTTPLEGERLRTAGYAEMQRLIREEEPPKPSTRLSRSGEQLTVIAKHRSISPQQLQKIVRGDLDWIVMKALEKDRARRYETPSSLADDVERFLADQPVQACPPSSTYRLRKFARRNRAMIAISGLITLILVAATVTSSWFAYESNWSAYEMKLARDQADRTLAGFRETVFQQGINYILNADEDKAAMVLKQLREDPNAADLADRLEAVLCLHNFEFGRAINILEPLVEVNPRDCGLRRF